MGLRGRDSDIAKRVASTSPSMKKKLVVVQREDELSRPISACSRIESFRSRIKSIDPICTARKKVVPVSPGLLVEENVDFDKQIGEGSFLSPGDDSMWLSSGCVSPSAFFEDHKLSSPFNHVADEWLVSWLSTLADSYVSLSKGASLSNSCKSNSEEHKSFTPAEALSGTWQLPSPGTCETDPPEDSVELSKSSCGNCSDEPTSDGNYSMSLCSNLESSLNLDEDSSQWLSKTELELDCFHSCFTSPSCKSSQGSEAKSSISTTINRKDEVTESNLSLETISGEENMEDFSADEPLFWPFDREIDWNSEETWKYFSMSPRKDIMKVTTPEGTSPRSIGSELNNKNRNLPIKSRKKLVLDSGSTASKILELKQGSKGYNNNSSSNNSGRAKRGNTMPSRLRETTKHSAKIVPLDIDNQILPSKFGEAPTTKPLQTSRSFWEDDITSNQELSIETVLGLGEFDGHEGIDSEFNEGVFSLDEAL
ncbi:hypothetical protein DITRI_Ditri17bG0025400 [Diplodiscus trichospermus]